MAGSITVSSITLDSDNTFRILSNTGATLVSANGTGIISGVASVSNSAISGVITAGQLATSLNLATNNVQVASIQSATGTPAITFAANGQMTLANTPLQLTGGGITFPATQVPSADANTLDDYEEGTWTPVITFGGNSTGITYSVNAGNYTKIGNMVYAHGSVYLSSKGSSTGAAGISLPFATKTGPPYDGPRASGTLGQYAGFSSVSNGLTIMADHTSTVAAFFQGNSGTGLTEANFQNSTYFYGFSIVYQTN